MILQSIAGVSQATAFSHECVSQEEVSSQISVASDGPLRESANSHYDLESERKWMNDNLDRMAEIDFLKNSESSVEKRVT